MVYNAAMNKIIELAKSKINIAVVALAVYLIYLFSIFDQIINRFKIGMFSFTNLISIILPLALFIISYFLLKNQSRRERIINATAITIISYLLPNIFYSFQNIFKMFDLIGSVNINWSLIIGLLSAVIFSLILSKYKTKKVLGRFYLFFIIAVILMIISTELSKAYILINSFYAETISSHDLALVTIFIMFEPLLVFVMAIVFGCSSLRNGSRLFRFYCVTIFSSLIYFACLFTVDIFDYNSLTGLIISYILSVVIFATSLMAINSKELSKSTDLR